jgi:hypothetical protein
MKRLISLTQAILACLLLSCNASDDNNKNTPTDSQAKASETADMDKNVVITDYSVNDAWPWINGEKEGLYVIRSLDDFYNCVKTHESAPLDIDFAKHSLVLIEGRANYGINTITKEMFDKGDNKWLFSVNITLNDACEVSLWRTAALVPALSADADVILSVTMTH